MKPIIGIIIRKNQKRYSIKEDVINVFLNKNTIPIGIFNKDKELIDKCNGILLPGGDDIEKEDLEIIKYIYEKDIPCLGICLGMQEMGYLFNGEMNKISNYNHLKPDEKYVHEITINKKSKLYQILKKEKIKVNSRHKDYLVKTDLDISSISDVIESIEDKNKRFFIGLQWHPESMIKYDINSNLLIDEFIKECNNHKNKNI
ncbi:MAG: gamma-glutamyl-gamma-aminobutyrate hydrolase family protein [Bacilli bacterium]|nr:gamma-glutamyl-gamma-aminobutyrate hydrolase family protein [Bacilli bacterium]